MPRCSWEVAVIGDLGEYMGVRLFVQISFVVLVSE